MTDLDESTVRPLVLHQGGKSPDNTGEPPGGDMLAEKVARLQDDMKEVKTDLRSLQSSMSEIRVALARIDAKLDSKIDYKWMSLYVLGIVAVIMREEIITWFK